MRGNGLSFVVAAFVVASGVAYAQQPVTVSNLIYDPCLDPSKVTVVAISAGAASGNTEHVAVSSSTGIYFCGGSLQGSATGQITVRFGSGSACASNTVDIDVIRVTADGEGKLAITGNGAGTVLRSAAARALCTNRSASMSMWGSLRYVQENLP